LNLFEIEKIFNYGKTKSDIIETYSLAWIIARDEKIVYYEIQNIVSDFLKTIGIDKIVFEEAINKPSYAHSGRIAKIIARGKEIWIVWEIHPQYSANFSTSSRIWFFELNAEVLASISYNTLKYKEISNFQANNFDLSFVVEKSVKWSTISNTISKINPLIKKVELFDIYEDEMKLWSNLRSLSFKIFIQSMEWTLDDNVKWTLINDIIAAVVKVWGKLR
jgi:phenylalanyl-tRNA synthetase beta chain